MNLKFLKNNVPIRIYDKCHNTLKHMDDVQNQTKLFCLIFAPFIMQKIIQILKTYSDRESKEL